MSQTAFTHTFSYRAYVLRIWHEGEHGAWRASLQSVISGEKILFNTLEQLCVYLLTLDDSMITTDLTMVNEASTSSSPIG
jgi:hypothetical protein